MGQPKGRRREMWKADPHCRKCGILTVWKWTYTERGLAGNTATIEHIYPAGHPLRATHVHIVSLYCWECNQKADWYFRATKGKLYSMHKGTLTWPQLYAIK